MDERRALTVDPDGLGHDARLDALEAVQRLRGAVDAQEQRLLAAIAGSDERVEQWVREEVSVVLRIAPQTANARLVVAQALVGRLPATVTALAAGRVTVNHARALVEAVDPLPDAAASLVEQRVLARAEGTSVAEFRAHCRRAALAVDPRLAAERHAAAVEQRSVSFSPESDGMGSLHAFLSAADIARIRQRVEACAHALGPALGLGDGVDTERTADQKRADVFVDLLLDAPVLHGAARPIHVVASLASLRGLSDEPGELDGEPVTADIVRQLANDPHAMWRPVMIDDDSGALLEAGARAYRPSAHLRRFVELRDRTCRFPGCRRRPPRTDLDHVTRFSEHGLTQRANLHCLCRRHHRLKDTDTGWHVTRHPDGTTTWTSPTHRHYTKPPDPYPGTQHDTNHDTEPETPAANDPPPY